MSAKKRARLSVFPKGYMDELTDGRMRVFEWIEMAGTLGAEGLEMYPSFLKRMDHEYLLKVKAAAEKQGLEIPMMCSSPDFTHPDAANRRLEIEKMIEMIEIMAFLGPEEFRSVRVLSGQNRPGIFREDGIRWTVESIK